jgi:hypothetical protein
MIKVICIKERKHLKLGSVYEAEPTSIVAQNNIKLFGYKLILGASWTYAVSDEYLMPYNEWLALEREKQIKSIIDE